jgi:phosphatidate cytidylyltransferase
VNVASPELADDAPSSRNARRNLLLRLASSLVLAPLALAAAWFGGLIFLTFWTIAAVVVLWEWDTLVCAHDRTSVLTIGVVALVGASLLLAFGWPGVATALIILGAFGVAVLASRIRRLWCAAGLFYAFALVIAPVALRNDAALGFAVMIFLFVIVWFTDTAAYFIGRAIGGPKLAPRISPNKTWSGAIGGTIAGVVGGELVAYNFGIRTAGAGLAVALALSIASQAGDLFESALKRRFNAKDASHLIPGHGGLMDRLDGFVVAVVVAALIGLTHGGFAAPSRGLMIW